MFYLIIYYVWQAIGVVFLEPVSSTSTRCLFLADFLSHLNKSKWCRQAIYIWCIEFNHWIFAYSSQLKIVKCLIRLDTVPILSLVNSAHWPVTVHFRSATRSPSNVVALERRLMRSITKHPTWQPLFCLFLNLNWKPSNFRAIIPIANEFVALVAKSTPTIGRSISHKWLKSNWNKKLLKIRGGGIRNCSIRMHQQSEICKWAYI